MASKRTLERLPAHRVPAAAKRRAAAPRLEVTGLVRRPGSLKPSDLQGLRQTDLTAPFECEEGWSVRGLEWRGLRLADVIQLTQPLPTASWVRVVAGPYAVPLVLADLGEALLATHLNGQPLAAEQGGPWRLIAPGEACFSSVKWVERLELVAEAGENTGQAIAKARLELPAEPGEARP